MFIRAVQKKDKNKEKTYIYYRLTHSYRVANKTRQMVILNLGKLEGLDKKYHKPLANRIEALVTGSTSSLFNDLPLEVEEIAKDKLRYPIVKKLWKLMLTGAYSIADIKREGDRLGLKNDNGKPYVIHTYHKLFTTEFYYGYFYWKDAGGQKKRYKGLHKPMVTPSEYNKVQCFIDNYRRPTRAKNYEYAYKGLLHCGECERSITAERKFQVRCTGCRHKFSCLHRNDCPKCTLLISDMQSPTIIDIVYYRCTKWNTKCSQKCITEAELEKQYTPSI